MKLIALGDNCIDVYRNSDEMHPGGNAVNVAVHTARSGVDAEYLGAFADDFYAELLQKALEVNGVRYDRCPVIPHSITKQCVYDVINGERTFVEVIAGEFWAGPIQLKERELEILREASVIVSSVNAKIPEQLKTVEELPAVFAYDFGEKEKYRSEEYYDLMFGKIDLAMFSCRPMSINEFREFADSLHRRGAVHVLATMGADGQMISNGTEVVHGSVEEVIPRDTMGAGDSFLSAVIRSLWMNGWQKGKPMPEDALSEALREGERLSSENCLTPGGFGS